ncbi:MAG: hypothetical protein Q8P18_18490 [Pseudomonadota bacterium]|nr:hypothetical protein [Pseudomonadota bacterium]
MTDDTLLHRELAARQADRAVVRIYRDRLGDEGILGRVAQFSEDVLVLARLDGESRDEGLTALRMDDITRIGSGTREAQAHTALATDLLYNPMEEASLTDLAATLSALARRYPILALHTEHYTPDETYIGVPGVPDDDHLVLQAWGSALTLDTHQVVLLHDLITRVDAGDAYLNWLVRAHALQRQG